MLNNKVMSKDLLLFLNGQKTIRIKNKKEFEQFKNLLKRFGLLWILTDFSDQDFVGIDWTKFESWLRLVPIKSFDLKGLCFGYNVAEGIYLIFRGCDKAEGIDKFI